MFLFSLPDIVQVPFGWLLSVLYQFTQSYGWALIIFAFVVKLILLPASAKGKKSSMKMSRISPRVKALQDKYADDPQRQSQEIRDLYKQEGVSMGGGCLWSFLPLPIMIALYSIIRQPITRFMMLGEDVLYKAIEEQSNFCAVKPPSRLPLPSCKRTAPYTYGTPICL